MAQSPPTPLTRAKKRNRQIVPKMGLKRASGVYQVTQLLPPEGKVLQYRIKNINEPHERVAKESELRRV